MESTEAIVRALEYEVDDWIAVLYDGNGFPGIVVEVS